MKAKIGKLFLLVVLINLTISCKDNTKEKKEEKLKDTIQKQQTTETKRQIPQDKRFNETARFIAGLPQTENNAFKEYENTEAWKSYSQESNKKWKSLKEGKLAKMRAWAEQELKEPNEQGGLVFYPFSGADFLHAQIFFPNADEIIMIGLEPIGTPLNIEKIAKKQTNYFSALNKAGHFLAEFSFFRTNDMAIDLTGKRSVEVDGTIHLIMLYLAQLENEIIYYEKVAINEQGKVVLAGDYKKVDKDNKDITIYGNRIFYKRKGDDKIRSLIYYSVNISDEGLNKKPEFKVYLQSLRPTATYLKAASYLMYSVEAPGKNYNFKTIRDLILMNSKYVLQDDSGMPLYNFPDAKWQKTFYGTYVGPISLFRNRYQTAMRDAYKNKENVKPLPFGIGYQFREGSSNLMLAKKIAEVTEADLAVKEVKEEKENTEKDKTKSKKQK